MNTLAKYKLLFYVGALLLLLPTCKKNKLESPGSNSDIVIDASVPTLTYSNIQEIVLDGSRTHDLNKEKILHFNWACTVYPTGMPPRIVDSLMAATIATTLSVGKYVFVLTVKDNLGNSNQENYGMEVLKDTLLPVLPKAFAGSDQSVVLPKTFAVLNGYSSYDLNALGRYLGFYWTLLSQPPGSQPIELTKQTFYVASVGELKEGSYKFQLRVTNEFGLYADDTIGVTVLPDPLAGTTKVYENLEWEMLGDWDSEIGIMIDGPAIFTYRNMTNMELRLWDETRQGWGDPHVYWETSGDILRINSGSTNQQLIGKTTKAQVRFF
jgi:hypothetical protein